MKWSRCIAKPEKHLINRTVHLCRQEDARKITVRCGTENQHRTKIANRIELPL